MPRNNADFHGVEIRHEIDEDDYATITAHLSGTEVGHLTLDDRGDVEDIQVDQAHQRKGIATAMWRHAQSLHRRGKIPNPPAHTGGTTEEGYKWAMTTGDPVPARHPEMFYDMSESSKPEWQGRD